MLVRQKFFKIEKKMKKEYEYELRCPICGTINLIIDKYSIIHCKKCRNILKAKKFKNELKKIHEENNFQNRMVIK